MSNTVFSCPAGTFSGIKEDGVIQIKGIRYAISERYARPEPYQYPDGVHEMVQNAPFAVQLPSAAESALQGTAYESFPQEESCQYLSITVPDNEQNARLFPVMVWFHGGSYRNGGCDCPTYDRRPLVKENNIIVVGVNSRLGVLGFVKDREGQYANNGLLDAIEGLKWIKANISAFGGDPENITIFGQSAGADTVRCVMLSKGTENLYRRAIIQSDPMGTMTGRADMEKKILDELNTLPLDASTQELREVQNSIAAHVTEKGPAKRMIFAPHYGVYPLPEEKDFPKRLREIAPTHELLIGSTTRESAIAFATSKSLTRLDRFFLTGWIIESVFDKIAKQIFVDPALAFAKDYARAGGKTYHFVFSWMEKESVIGACHMMDVLPLFGPGQAEGKLFTMGQSVEELYQKGIPMRKIWADYAKTGEISQMKIDGMIEIQKLPY